MVAAVQCAAASLAAQDVEQRIEYVPTVNAAASRKVGLDAYWEDGLWFESANKQFRLHVGGSAQIDSTWLIGPKSAFALPNGGANGIDNAAGTFLRRARL